ncbi:3919_t:CDS:1, partial [Racocetra persica]
SNPMNYFIDNLTTLIGITWEQEKIKTWRNNMLMKLLHHSNLAPSKHRMGALYDTFTKTSILGPEHILALA